MYMYSTDGIGADDKLMTSLTCSRFLLKSKGYTAVLAKNPAMPPQHKLFNKPGIKIGDNEEIYGSATEIG